MVPVFQVLLGLGSSAGSQLGGEAFLKGLPSFLVLSCPSAVDNPHPGPGLSARKGSQFTFFSFLMKCQRLVSEGKCQNSRQKEKNIPFLFSGQAKQGS